MSDLTVRQSIDEFINKTRLSRTENTTRAYQSSLDVFVISMKKRGFDPNTIPVANFTENWIEAFVSDTKHLAPRTQALYLAVVRNWSKFIAGLQYARVDLQRIYSLTRQNTHRSKSRPRTLPAYHEVSRVVEYAMSLGGSSSGNTNENLGHLRDRALIVILADTGLDLLNICQLRRGDIDWKNRKIAPRSKSRRETIDLTPRAFSALADYLKARAPLDKASKLAEASLPLLARHDGKTGKKVVPLTITAAGRTIAKVIHAALGVEDDGSITVVSFRRYYTGSILQSFVLLHPRITQRCQGLFENGHYDEAIFNAMKVIEDEVRSKISADPTDVGYKLIVDAMGKKPPLITFSTVEAEQESAFALFRGAIGSFKNPRSHRFVETSDPIESFECLALASLLMRMLDKAT